MEFFSDSLEISIDEERESSINDGSYTIEHRRHESNELANNEPLSSWEKWLMKKTIDYMQKRRKKHEQLLQVDRKQNEEKIKETERRIKAKDSHRKWVEQKNAEEKRKSKEMSQKHALNSLVVDQKKVSKEEKSKERYKKWLEVKAKQKIEKNKLEAEEHERMVSEKQHRQKLAEQAYSDWVALQSRRKEKWWITDNRETICDQQSWIGPLDNKTD